MSRSGYSDDVEDQWALLRWRGAVTSSLRGARGQAFLRELLKALDAMPDKRLIANAAKSDGCMCTLGVVAAARGMDLDDLDAAMEAQDWDWIAKELGIASAMAREVMYENDETVISWAHRTVEIHGPMRPRYPDWGEHLRHYTEDDPTAPARRWLYMRNWVAKQIGAEAAA